MAVGVPLPTVCARSRLVSRREGFRKQPHWLVQAMDRGDLAPFGFMLLCYLGGRGLENHGVSVTGELAGRFDCAAEADVSVELTCHERMFA